MTLYVDHFMHMWIEMAIVFAIKWRILSWNLLSVLHQAIFLLAKCLSSCYLLLHCYVIILLDLYLNRRKYHFNVRWFIFQWWVRHVMHFLQEYIVGSRITEIFSPLLLLPTIKRQCNQTLIWYHWGGPRECN